MMAAARSQFTTLYSLPDVGFEWAEACVIDELRRQAARHRLGDADDVVGARARIARRAEVVGGAVAAEVELGELGPVGVPLEDDRLGPVVEQRRAEDDVLVDVDVDAIVERHDAVAGVGGDRGQPVPVCP